MVKIVEYFIVSKGNIPTLIESINNLIKNNWQPVGRIYEISQTFYHGMVKYETEKESFDKSMAEEINKLSEDLNEKLFSELLKTSIKENELLRDEIKSLKEIIKIEREFSQQLNQKITDYRIEISSLIQEKFELKESIGFIK